MSKLLCKWADFKLSPMKFLKAGECIRVDRGDGSYLVVEYFSPFVEDRVKTVTIKGQKPTVVGHRCNLCGGVYRVLWVIPYDATYSPGWYCYKCRKVRNILDVDRAKKYGKVI